MSNPSDHLYELLPAVYRVRDAEQGEVLRALLEIVGEELGEVEENIADLYENWFIETCDEWVVPYIGDLLAVRGLNTIKTTAFSQRAYVGNTLFYRRRKGTAYVLAKIASDVTGWYAYETEFFQRLQTTQYLNHLRLFNTTPDLRDVNSLDLLDTAFDKLPYTVDVRHIHNRRGKHNIANIGIFLWRLQNYPLQKVTARKAQAPHAYGYHFSSLGNPAPLFNKPMTAGFPDEQLVPEPIRPLAFYFDLKTYDGLYGTVSDAPENSRYYGPLRSFYIRKDGVPVKPEALICKNLSAWDRPPPGKVAIDVKRGRIAFSAGEEPAKDLIVSYNYGFSADIGGGPYDRLERIAEIELPVQPYRVGAGEPYQTLADALSGWESAGKPPGVIRICDSATYDAGSTIKLPKNGMLTIDCENEERPTLLDAMPLTVTSEATREEETPAFMLNGLLIEGSLKVDGRVNLTLTDCTLVPGISLDEDGYPEYPEQASVVVGGTGVSDTSIVISRSIVGALELPSECRKLAVSDSIVFVPLSRDADTPARAAVAANQHGTDPGPVSVLERVTVFGKVYVKELELASETIFVHLVETERKQQGCVRFSYVPDGSKTPRRYRCQPDLAIAVRKKELDVTTLPAGERERIVMRVRPRFTSLRYGQPAFCQLAYSCAQEIATGAEDGSEMGVYCLLQQPQRLANLRIALDEYLRFGLEAGIFRVT